MSRKRSAPTPVEEDFSPLEAPEDPEEQEPQERAVRGKPRKKTKSAADDDEEYYRSLAKGLDIEDDEDDMSESEIPAPQAKRSDDCEAGHIQSIYVENFMCHRKFSIDLRPGLNFIVGKNGSGKSAVAAAIQLCLGGTARNTGRGSSTRSMVREGSEKPALVRVTMLNTGSDAYRPDVYGDRIIIERKIARSGGVGGYSIRGSKDKKTVSFTHYSRTLLIMLLGNLQFQERAGQDPAHFQHPRGQPLLRADARRIQAVHSREH